jgi:hypothetical protein
VKEKTMKLMKKLISLIVVTFLLLSFSVTPLVADELPEPSADEVAADLLFVRPVALCSIVVGSAIYVVGLLFTIPTGNLGLAGRKLVVEPVKYTFAKPLGQLDTPFRLEASEH